MPPWLKSGFTKLYRTASFTISENKLKYLWRALDAEFRKHLSQQQRSRSP